MATKDQLDDTLRVLKRARPDQVEIVSLPDGGFEIHFIPLKKIGERSEKAVYGAEKRNRLILEIEKQLGGRGEEDSDEWIRMIKKSRTFSKTKTYDFS